MELEGSVSDLRRQLYENIAEKKKLETRLEVAKVCVPDELKVTEPEMFKMKPPQFAGKTLWTHHLFEAAANRTDGCLTKN